MPILTIAIPTFNRATELRRRLLELLPQLDERARLVVFDNGSTDIAESDCTKFREQGVEFRRSPINMGMSRNFLRCWEESDGEWVWILGDDDPVQADAVSRILSLITANSHFAIINFETNACHNELRMEVTTLHQLFAFKDATALMFISSLLFRRAAVLPALGAASQAAITLAPHVALIFRVVEDALGPILFVKDEFLLPQANDFRVSSLELALGMAILPEFVRDERDRAVCAAGLWNCTRWMFVMGLREVETPENWRRWRRIYRQTSALLRAGGARFFQKTISPPNERHLRDELISFTFSWLPWWLARLGCSRMRRRWKSEILLRENVARS
jgi:glycosyltransferase involved in cell wall biosynthesis